MEKYDERDSVLFTDIQRRDEFLNHLEFIGCDAVVLGSMPGLYKVVVLERREKKLVHGE